MDPEQIKRAVDGIVRDLRDRRGLKSEWGMIDPEIRQEIEQEWAAIIERAAQS